MAAPMASGTPSTRIAGIGVWSWLDSFSAQEVVGFARRIEDWGYTALWMPEAVGRDPFTLIGYLAANTRRLVLCTGIANIYARDAMAMKAIHETAAELAPGRFVLGLGVSHAPMVTGQRGHEYRKPVPAMRDYLDAMEKAVYAGPRPAREAPIVLAALRPLMLKLAAARTRGAHPYFVPPEHTGRARKILGPDAWLCPEQMVLRESDPAKARATARQSMQIYLGLPNYRNNLLELGFTERDLDGGGSDRLVDAIVAWGDLPAIRARIQAHIDAGADHVCIQALRPDGVGGPDEDLLEALAPGVRGA